jgi:outer membrane protein assembly factor BamB
MKIQITIILFTFFVNISHAQYKKTFGFRPINMVNVEIIKSVSSEYTGELWQFPKQEIIDTVTFGYNLFGTGRFKPIANIIDIEPSSFSNVHILKNGNILAICPTNIAYYFSASEIVFKAVKLYYPCLVSVYLLDKTGGKIIWEKSLQASGVFLINEYGNYIVINSQNIDSEGIKGKKIHILDKATGKVIFEKGNNSTKIIDFNFEQDLVSIIDKDSSLSHLYQFSLYKPDKAKPFFSKNFNSEELMFPPYIQDDKILFLSKNKLCLHDITKSKNAWEFDVDTTTIKKEIRVFSNKIFIPSDDKIIVIDIASGRKLWNFQLKDEYTGLNFVGENIYLLQQTQYPRELDKKTKKLVTKHIPADKLLKKYKKKPFELIDIEQYDYLTRIISISANGKKNWEVETEGIKNSNFFLKEDKLYLTTNKFLYAIDNQKGKLVNNSNLHKNNAYVQFFINQLNKNLIVRNDEWVYCFNGQNLDSIYAHHFDLVCPSFSREQLNRDIETGRWFYERNILRKPASTFYVNKSGYINSYNYHYNNAIRTGGATSYNAHQYASYHRTLDNLSGDIGNAAGTAINMVQFAKNMMHILAIRIYLAQQDAHPYVENEALNLMNFDDESQAVRIIRKNINGQKFIAIEILELESGQLKFQILSPFQFKEDILTMYTNFGSLFPFTGYALAINIRDLVFRTSIDWKNKRIYHYGPGLDVDSYRYYNPKKPEFIRGKLICLPFDFKGDKKYL